MSEQLTPSSVEANNAELSQRLQDVNVDNGFTGTVGEMVAEKPDGSVQINKNFNQGVVQGPVLPNDEQLKMYVEAGWDKEETMKMLADEEQARRIGVNTYPVQPVGEMKVVYDALEARAKESEDKARPAVEVPEQSSELAPKTTKATLGQRALRLFKK